MPAVPALPAVNEHRLTDCRKHGSQYYVWAIEAYVSSESRGQLFKKFNLDQNDLENGDRKYYT